MLRTQYVLIKHLRIERYYNHSLIVGFSTHGIYHFEHQGQRVKGLWLLISQGYNTYLLLTRNFPIFYPNRRTGHPSLRDLVDNYCEQLYPGKLDHERMVLDFGPQPRLGTRPGAALHHAALQHRNCVPSRALRAILRRDLTREETQRDATECQAISGAAG